MFTKKTVESFGDEVRSAFFRKEGWEDREEPVRTAEYHSSSSGGYRIVDLRGKIPGSPKANQGTQKKTDGVVIHYNGPATGVPDGRVSPFNVYYNDARYHMSIDWGGGARANGIQYHYGVWEDTVYILRNPDSILWHCGCWPHNASAYAINVPIGVGERATQKTIETLAAFVRDLVGAGGKVWGHRELSPTACPGSLMEQFVYPYRSGALQAPGDGWEPAKYTFISGSVKWGEPRCELLVEEINSRSGERLAAWTGRPVRAKYASQLAYESYPVGKRVVVAVGRQAKRKLSPNAKAVLGKYPRSESDIWDGRTDKRLRDCIAEIERREGLEGVLSAYEERFGPLRTSPRKKKPQDDIAAAIDGYFAANYGQFGPYVPLGSILVEEAERANLHVTSACTLVEQESGGRNIFGADWGVIGADRVPFARLPVTRSRLERLLAHIRQGGTSNGVGVTQLTYPPFIYRAERYGGAHLVRYQMRVGFEILAELYGKYPYLEAIAAYNAGEANRRSVISTYARAFAAKHEAWRKRLERYL